MLTLNDMLIKSEIEPSQTIVFRHSPRERDLQRIFPTLAAEEIETFNAYQQTQGRNVENALKRAKHVVSCIGIEPGLALFIGLYKVNGSTPLTYDEYWAVPAYQRMKAFGMIGMMPDQQSVLWFDLVHDLSFAGNWKGRLVLQWPGRELSWWRWADRNVFAVDAIHPRSILERELPPWQKLTLSWAEVSSLPRSWQNAMAQWRGIYLIVDQSDGSGYVGSAYGSENILARWRQYAASGHGGNKGLQQRDPKNFRFSILQLVAQDLDHVTVIGIEAGWKDRLMTREFGLNKN